MGASVISGERQLPRGSGRHPHASEQARRIAEDGLILRSQVGSGVHGTAIDGQDDRDELGICLEPAQFVTGLAKVPDGEHDGGQRRWIPFEQYEWHTAWDGHHGRASRSGPGDLDVVVYSARKWARLALDGNPTVLLVLFVPDAEVVHREAAGAELVDNASRFVSRRVAASFYGYLQSQRARAFRRPTEEEAEADVAEDPGYHPKSAMHALRLAVQGVELLTEGTITLPIPAWHRDYLVAVRRGELPASDVLAAIDDSARRLASLRDADGVPDEPDRAWVDGWLHRSHLAYWSRRETDGAGSVG